MKPENSAKKRVRILAAVLLFALCAVAHAQSIVGTWQATFPATATFPEQRTVVKISTAKDSSLKGMFIPIDRNPDGFPLTSVKFTAPDFSFVLGAVSYQGKMSADGNSIVGTWNGMSAPNTPDVKPLTWARATPDTAWTYSGPKAPPPMAENADPSFEVATIRPTKPGSGNGHAQFILGRRKFEASNCTAMELIKIAYFVRGRQVVDGPKWINDQQWDVVAETDSDIPGQPSEAQTRVMVRKLLEQRFGLKVHLTQREFSVYAMVLDKVDKPSPKLTKSDVQDKPMMIAGGPPGADGLQTLQFANASMKEFAALMMNMIQTHQIVDETGLAGKYDFTLTIQQSAFQSSPGVEDLPDPAFVQAIQPFGLKFVMKKEPLEVVLVDHLEQPTAN
jgi:uncharacterized protein (TIGR03435 family)